MSEMKVTLHPQPQSPSEQVIAKASQSFHVTDSAGRVILLKKPGVLAQFRLVEALGATAENNTYMRMVLPLIYVAEIDNQPVATVFRKAEVDALIQRLDEHGIAAVMEGLKEHFGAQDPEADRATLKK